MKKYAIIVAGGTGTRMKAGIPKQFILLKGKPVLMHTIEVFYRYDDSMEILITLPASVFGQWEQLCREYHFHIPHRCVAGGTTRFHSVKNALAEINENGLIAVHDGVRPLVSIPTISKCFVTAEKSGNAIPVITISESIRQIDEPGSKAVDRSQFRLVQTPQVFQSNLLSEAYQQPYTAEFTDDASVVEKLGITIQLVEGNIENIKITTPTDLLIAKALMDGY